MSTIEEKFSKAIDSLKEIGDLIDESPDFLKENPNIISNLNDKLYRIELLLDQIEYPDFFCRFLKVNWVLSPRE